MGNSNILTYAVVFLTVFVPYLFVQFCLENRRRQETDADSLNLPGIFKTCYGVIGMLANSLGRRLASMQPERNAKIKNQLTLGAIRMEPEYVFAAEALFGIFECGITQAIAERI